MNDLASGGIGRWLGRLGIAIPVIVVGGYFAAIIADLAWDLGLLPLVGPPSYLIFHLQRQKQSFSFAGVQGAEGLMIWEWPLEQRNLSRQCGLVGIGGCRASKRSCRYVRL